mgnify:CR=1 FL=1
MARKKLDPIDMPSKSWADPCEIPDDELDEMQASFEDNVLDAVRSIKDISDDTERVVGVTVTVISVDKTRRPSDPDATRIIAASALVIPPEWAPYEGPIMAAGAKCLASLATDVIERGPEPEPAEEPPYVPPSSIHLRDTNVARVEDLFELFSDHALENVPVLFPAVVAEQMFNRAQFITEANLFWPIIVELGRNQTMPHISKGIAKRLLNSWDDDMSLAIQAMLYVNMAREPLDELDLSDQLFELCHIVCSQIHSDLETIVYGTSDQAPNA